VCFDVLLLVEGVFFILFCLRGDFVANAFTDKLDAIVADAAVASAAVGTIVSGSDAVVDNFAGLKDLVDELSAFASLMKSNTFYAPVGLIAPFGGLSGSIPAGWFLCDGSAKSTSTYADLYAVLGVNAYGTDADGNFYLPDLRGRVPVGLNAANGDVDSRLDNDNIATLANRSPKHSHSISSLSVVAGGAHSHTGGSYGAGGHSHTIDAIREVIGRAAGGSTFGKLDNGGSQGTSGVGDHSHGIYIDGVGNHGHSLSGTVGVGSGLTDTMPYAVTNYIIKW